MYVYARLATRCQCVQLCLKIQACRFSIHLAPCMSIKWDMYNVPPEQGKQLEQLQKFYNDHKFVTKKVPVNLGENDVLYMLSECRTKASVIDMLEFLWAAEQNKKQQKRKIKRAPTEPGDFVYSEPVTRREKWNKRFLGIKTMMLGQPLVFDMCFNRPELEQYNIRKSALDSYQFNYKHVLGFHLHYTSIGNNSFLQSKYVNGDFNWMYADVCNEPFWELFAADQLVYLSPFGPKIERYDGNAVYVVPGLADIFAMTREETVDRTDALDIRTGWIPLEDYIRLESSEPIGMYDVLNILLAVNLNHSWERAIYDNLPKLKYPALHPSADLFRSVNPRTAKKLIVT